MYAKTSQELNIYRVSHLTSKRVLPIEPSHSRHHIEVSVPAQQWKTVLPAQGRNPKVIRWNRLSSLSQFDADSCIMMRSLLVNVEYSAVSHETIQPPPIPNPIARLCNPEAIFPNYHDWKGYLLSPGQHARDARMLLRGSGKRVCVEDQSLVSEAHNSESTTSNVSSITLLIRCVSLRRSLSLPTCFIHGL